MEFFFIYLNKMFVLSISLKIWEGLLSQLKYKTQEICTSASLQKLLLNMFRVVNLYTNQAMIIYRVKTCL